MDQSPAPMHDAPVEMDRNPAAAREVQRVVESADVQAVDWKKKFEDAEKVNKQLQAKIKAMACKINKRMKKLRIENTALTNKFVNLIGKTPVFLSISTVNYHFR